MGKKINNLKEFFEARGFAIEENTMWYYGRCLYKFTFGPWVSYIMEDKPEETQDYVIVVLPGPNQETTFVHECDDLPHVLRFFNTADNEALYPEYVELLKNFLAEEHPQHVNTHRDWDAEFLDDRTIIRGTWTTPPTTREIYYEDKWANTHTLKMQDSCIGIKVGSIVEGSDVELEPRTFIFPFDEDDYDKRVDDLGEEVNFYWKRDNCRYYSVHNQEEGESIYCQWIDFESQPSGSFTEEQLELAVAAGNALYDSEVEGNAVPGFPGWEVTEEETPDYVY